MNDGEATSDSNPAYEFEAPPDASSPAAQHRVSTKFFTEEPCHVWDHFAKLQDCDPNDPIAECIHCMKRFNFHHRKHGTSALLAHISFGCEEYPYIHAPVDKPEGSEREGESDVTEFSVERLRMGLARMIIIDELPLRIVEGEGFLDFMAMVEPRFPVPSRLNVIKDCIILYVKEKEKLKKVLSASQRVCLTTDTWTSLENLNYLCLTAHFIDNDWNYHKKILNFCLVPNLRGETIGRMVESCLLEWDLIDKIFTITVDNASSNDVAVEFLRRKTKDRKGSLLSSEFLHIRCCAHILKLIVLDGLKDLSESIMKIRNAMRYVKSSHSRFEQFKECVMLERISSKKLVCLDIPTRWDSTYKMLNAAQKCKKAFERMEEDEEYDEYLRHFCEDDGNGKTPIGPPNSFDWENIQAFSKFLKLFYEAALQFSGSLFVTSNAYFHELVLIQSELSSMCCSSGDPLLKDMAENMKKKFDNYWGSIDRINSMLFVAVVLDPRYKLNYVKFWFKKLYDNEQVDDMVAKVRGTLDRLYEHYATKATSEGVSRQPIYKPHSSQLMVDTNVKDVRKRLNSLYKLHLVDEDNAKRKSEVDQYLLDGCEDPEMENFDILNWWKVNSSKYRILGQVARDVLAIPVSTVASRSAFSTGGRVFDPFQSPLSPRTIEAFICAQNWLRSSHSPINIGEAMKEVEGYQINSGNIICLM